MKNTRTHLIIILAFFIASCSKAPIGDMTPKKVDNSVVDVPIGGNEPNNPDTDKRGHVSVPDDSHLLLGNPDDAQPSILFPNKYLMDEKYYIESYNNTTHCPNWVSWHLSAPDIGTIKRSDSFRANTELPTTWYAVTEKGYEKSGFDRGHNCPSGDRTSTNEANSMTFLMTNMIPQAPRNNRETWEGLESYTRSLIKEGNEAYIVAGTYGSGGTGASGYMEAIHNGNILINVPSHFWKIIVVIPNGSDDLNRIKPDTRVIAIDTPNDNSLNSDWKKYRTSVHAIEEATGYHLLTNLPLEVRTALELKVDHL